MNKSLEMQKLIEDLRLETSIENIIAKRKGEETNVGMVNQFKHHELIPNKWFDWQNRVNAEIMIIGQDWGPYNALLTYFDDYDIASQAKGFNYKEFLFSKYSSRTEKFIMQTIQKTYSERFNEEFPQKLWDKFYFTAAVLFTRSGKKFRGNENFDEKRSFEISYPYFARQLDIVKPRIILTMGNLPLKAVDRYFNLNLKDFRLNTLLKQIENDRFIKSGNTYIIPSIHPSAYSTLKLKLNIWKTIWELY